MAKEKDALDIITDPENMVKNKDLDFDEPAEEVHVKASENEEDGGISRRNFLRWGSAAAAAATVAGAGGAGFAIGRSDDAYTGYGRTYQGGDMFFNREPFRTKTAAMMEPVSTVIRADRTDFIFDRIKGIIGMIEKGEWNPGLGLDKMPGVIGDYYRKKPEDFKIMMDSLGKYAKSREDWKNGKHLRYTLPAAYTEALAHGGMYNRHGSTIPEDPDDVYMETGEEQPPEKWDFRHVKRDKPMEFKSPKHATKLIKRMAHLFGTSIVGIGKFDERFMFTNKMRGMKDGGAHWGNKVPEHWKSIIIFGVPMYWDQTYAAIGYCTSYDAYFRSRVTAGLLERFIHELGYPARAQFPGYHYEIMMEPFLLTTGLGEYSRSGMVMVPELGCNVRPAAVVTNIEFEYDQPIDVKMADFCLKCKICAETCPSGAIPTTDKPETVVRGFKRWYLDQEKCYNQWASGQTVDALGCRVCMGVCPYTRKNTWIHSISRELEPRDPTGLVSSGLLAMQKNFFKYPEAQDFRSDWLGGTEATYHNPPWYLRAEEVFKGIDKTWEYHGME
ncbi:reductive dehalogenase [Desulfuromusa kysingii]|uniref:Reductive dehalogenase n=1 Tax=Desulfuromusa kysingii TaxID=37625 RepID=A0A1H4DFU3_9BACT|nr:4Fe-4S dicluster domain-containing protein [Desulfuromusa kysingii]SEA71467.1 reductive dehalogenase [Desulfuromusa kysingii]